VFTLNYQLRPGDLIEVKQAAEILVGLDEDGVLDGLPFMPEMLEFCGNAYRVKTRVVQVTIDGADIPSYNESYVREFKNNDVVILEGLRCSGLNHGKCQRGCLIYWKESWLRKIEVPETVQSTFPFAAPAGSPELRTMRESDTYFCQSSEFRTATKQVSRIRRFGKCITSVRYGNVTSWQMMKGALTWAEKKIKHKMGLFPHGNRTVTPTQKLGLAPGEIVRVKPFAKILETLDNNGLNRGLHFSGDMVPFCGQRFRVKSRTERLISEGTGRMRKIPNTVILEGVTCDGFYYAFGGCPRKDYQYWREIWLERV
jgi:hypothetical protein